LEDWQPLNAPSSTASSSNPSNTCSSSNIDISSLKQHLSSSPYLLPAHGQSGCVADFDAWVQAGNPFTIKARTRAVGGELQPALSCLVPWQQDLHVAHTLLLYNPQTVLFACHACTMEFLLLAFSHHFLSAWSPTADVANAAHLLAILLCRSICGVSCMWPACTAS
jgi:hypothetical protein